MAKPISAGTAAALLFIFLWNLKWVVHRQKQWNIRAFLLIWWAMYSLFLLWWLPPYKQLILPNIVPIVLLASFTIRDLVFRWSPGGRGSFLMQLAGGLLLVMFSMSNFFSSVLPLHISKGVSYTEAEKLNRSVSPICQIYTTFHDALYLEYYFDRETLFVRSKLHDFYHTKDLDHLKQVTQDNLCVIIPLKFVSPDHQIGEMNLARIDGYRSPERYLSFIEWLFKVDFEASAGSLLYSSFKVLSDEIGNSYIVIEHNQRRHSRGMAEIFDDLDRRIEASRQAPYGVFRAWREATMEQLPDRIRAEF
jgi:hypothetical protein